jgi:hypothetical protein
VSFFTHAFEGRIERFGVGRSRVIWYQVLFLPPTLAAELPFDRFPRLRVRGEIADVPVDGAWMPTGDGRRYFIVPPLVRKVAEVGVGSEVEMRFLVDDQDRVETPAELDALLRRDDGLRGLWEALTPGRRRGLSHLINGAKGDATRARRLEDVLREIRGEGESMFVRRRP